MNIKKIIITGVTGQDGSFMADYLLKNTEHTVVAGVRRLSEGSEVAFSRGEGGIGICF